MKYFNLFAIILFISCGSVKDPVPSKLFDFNIEKKLTGEEAVAFINRLHNKSVTDTENIIGFYSGPKGKLIIYLTKYESAKNAETDFERMTKKISPQNSVFLKGNFSERKGIKIYSTFGMGMTHFVFRHNKDLYWISAGTMWASEFLDQYLDYLEV